MTTSERTSTVAEYEIVVTNREEYEEVSKNPDSYPGKNTIVIDSDKNFPIEIVGGQKGWFWIRAINESNIFVKNGAQVGVSDDVRAEAFDDSTIIARGRAIVFGHDSSRVEAGEEVFVRLFDKSDAKVFGNVEVRAEDNSEIKAEDHASVVVLDHAVVSAHDYVSVVASGRSSVKAFDRVIVKALDESSVEAEGCCTVRSFENSRVEARVKTKVFSQGSSYVTAHENSVVEAAGASVVRAFHSAKVTTVEGGCAVAQVFSSDVSFEGSNIVKCFSEALRTLR